MAGRAVVWGMWAIRDPKCRWEVLTCPVGASGLNRTGGKEGDLIEAYEIEEVKRTLE